MPRSVSNSRIGLVWFTNDLRLHDNPTLAMAAAQVDRLICVFCYQPQWSENSRYGLPSLGAHRKTFLNESLWALSKALEAFGHKLLIAHQDACLALPELIQRHQVSDVFVSRNAGWDERQRLNFVETHAPHCQIHVTDSHTLFEQAELPFELADLPATFTQFRKRIEANEISIESAGAVMSLPPMPTSLLEVPEIVVANHDGLFIGGEAKGLEHLAELFSSSAPSTYKQTRNALDGWASSCKFSPWLANGSVSVREVLAQLKEFEQNNGANDSTYWIYFELLWREYFQWYAHRHNTRLFKFGGIKDKSPLTSFYAERFQKWCSGNTPYRLVNACMRELNATGFLSNRARQIVASCLVNELSLDWRYGAAYFEHQLIDYDVASNWGNWQYLAGVGADVKASRRFDLDKQAKLFDPDNRYQSRWAPDHAPQSLDSVDAADWPIA